MVNIHLLLLAAGASTRMEQPKQLLPWGHQTLIEHQVKNLLATKYELSVVLGAYSEKIIGSIDMLPLTIFINENWAKGMSRSIAFGVEKVLEKDPGIEAILISLVDQPLITTAYFNKMLWQFQKGKSQVLVSHSDKHWSGTPVLFDRTYFKELKKLKGDQGAKSIITKNNEAVIRVDAGDLLQDLDTLQVYLRLLQEFKDET